MSSKLAFVIVFLTYLTLLTNNVVVADEATSIFWDQFKDIETSSGNNNDEYGFWAAQEEITTTDITSIPYTSSCINNLKNVDDDQDTKLSLIEYVNFIQLESECTNITITTIPQAQKPFFVGLACLCLGQPGAAFSCCTDANAKINIPTTDQQLSIVCNLKYLGNTFCGELPDILQKEPTISPTTTREINLNNIPSISPNSDVPSDITSDVPSTFIPSDALTTNPSDRTSDLITDVQIVNPSSPPSSKPIISDAPTSSPSDITSDISSTIIPSDKISSSPSSMPSDFITNSPTNILGLSGRTCSSNKVCAREELDGDCCPTKDNKYLNCCDNYDPSLNNNNKSDDPTSIAPTTISNEVVKPNTPTVLPFISKPNFITVPTPTISISTSTSQPTITSRDVIIGSPTILPMNPPINPPINLSNTNIPNNQIPIALVPITTMPIRGTVIDGDSPTIVPSDIGSNIVSDILSDNVSSNIPSNITTPSQALRRTTSPQPTLLPTVNNGGIDPTINDNDEVSQIQAETSGSTSTTMRMLYTTFTVLMITISSSYIVL